MGYKRPFDNEELQELTYKQQKQFDCSNKLTSFAEEVPCNDAPQKLDISGEDKGGSGKSQRSEDPEISVMADKQIESGTPLSWLTSTTSEENGVRGKEAYSSFIPEYFEFNLPRRTFVQPEDIYPSFLDRYSRKQVPIGPNHQANVPAWDLQKNKSDRVEASNLLEASPQLMGSDHIFYTEDEERLLGICVIPMPDSNLSAQDGDKAGDGRKDCNCLDGGSVRCVQLHTVEARDKLRKNFGLEKFVALGFGEMGDEVARKWSEEEEQIFHEVVFSNPASLGTIFWKHLALELPYRTTRELISYYFNVFMLRRRAAQNRFNSLEIDSDDDEWHGRNGDSINIAVMEEDEDSSMESLLDEDDQLGDEDGSSEDYDDSDDDGNDDDGDGDLLRDGDRIHMLESHSTDKILGSFGEELGAQDDSCLSFDCQPNLTDSCSPVEGGAVMQVGGSNNSKCWHGDRNGSNNGAGTGYLLDDSDVRSSTSLDLLPTFNMIEEFFGPGSWKDTTNDDKVIN